MTCIQTKVRDMARQELDYYLHDDPAFFRFELKGDVSEEGASRLEQIWHTASSSIGDRRPIIDITFVRSVHAKGRALLAGWGRAGAHLVANSKASRELAELILGEPLVPHQPPTRRRLPFRGAFLKCAVS